MGNLLQDIDARTNLTSNSQFELLLFRLGTGDTSGSRETFGINVFKVREIMPMPAITSIVGTERGILGVANIRGDILPVIDLPAVVGCAPRTGLNILLITEFARTTQAFAIEEVDEIVRLKWDRVMSAEANGGSMVTSIAKLNESGKLIQVLDVEQILRLVMPVPPANDATLAGTHVTGLKSGQIVLAADDSRAARAIIEEGLKSLNVPCVMTHSGLQAWTKLLDLAERAERQRLPVSDLVAMVLTDLEMPEMDGFTLTRQIKQDPRFSDIPVVIHSSLSGKANEDHVRHVGADAYVAKFSLENLRETMSLVLGKQLRPDH